MATRYRAAVEKLDRLERLANVVLLLLDAERPMTLTQIAGAVGGYPPSREALRRSFERDKALLREEGIPVSTVPLEGSEQYGYTIEEEEYYLPRLGLTDEEQLALNMAASAVGMGGSAGRDALLKLGLMSHGAVPAALGEPPIECLTLLDQASRARSAVTFEYHGRARTVDPYGLVASGGRWYLVAKDHDAGDTRRFRVDRMESTPETGPPAAFELPEDFDLAGERPSVPWRLGEGELQTAVIAVDQVAAPEVLADLGREALVETRQDGWSVVRLEVSNPEAFRSWIAGLLDHAEVLAPAELRNGIASWYEAIARATR